MILSQGRAKEALEWTRGVMRKIGLTLNEEKITIKESRRERFDFLGYTFGPHRYRKDGHWYLGASPSSKSVSRMWEKVGDLLKPSNKEPWRDIGDWLNRLLRSWSGYLDKAHLMKDENILFSHSN